MRLWLGYFKEAYKQWAAHKSSRLAAALAYYTVFSMAPLLLILIAIAGLFFGAQAAHGQITGQLSAMVGHSTAAQIDKMVAAANRPKSGIIATLIAIVMLVLGASGVVLQLQDALNTVWDEKPENAGGIIALIRERLLSFGMILGLAFLLMVSLVIGSLLTALNTYTASLAPALSYALRALNLIFDAGILSVLFAMIYKYLPQTKVRWGDVWAGSTITAALFLVGQFAITLYLGKMNVASPYGDAGSIIIILLWVYYSAQLVLFGAEFTRVWAEAHRHGVAGTA
ncbi:MAG: ribonuclease BN [Candidatus Meridianibacter frigidus]|nr:MAG: ribonuclease BN [Candidatus Eremiobacteraeota bacterium]